MLKIENIKLNPSYSNADLLSAAAKRLKISENEIKSYKILKKSVDARRKNDIHIVISLVAELNAESGVDLSQTKNCSEYTENKFEIKKLNYVPEKRPVIAGFGPAGIFCALTLATAGLKPIIIERGKPVERRVSDVEAFFERGALNLNSNIQFGEGGAGTFSDGKLTTGTKDKRQSFVVEQFIAHGAPEDIAYLAKPHIGTDKLREIIPNMRAALIKAGCEFRFESTFSGFDIKDGRIESVSVKSKGKEESLYTDYIIAAIGHSARDTVEMLYKNGVHIVPKNFACGVRIEHLQNKIDIASYGDTADFKNLPASDYKLVYHAEDGRSAYTFCVCPGGFVIGAASEQNSQVTNGMSEYLRDGINCNGALLVNVTPEDFGSDSPLAGIEFQRRIERAAYIAGGGNYNAPVQKVSDFLEDKVSFDLGEVIPTYRPGYKFAMLKDVFPEFITRTLKEALPEFEKKIRGFAVSDAVLTAAETRSSSPVKIVRGEDFQSNIKGLFPCGEGAGYAGGIMSAAVDGIKCAEAVIKEVCI